VKPRLLAFALGGALAVLLAGFSRGVGAAFGADALARNLAACAFLAWVGAGFVLRSFPGARFLSRAGGAVAAAIAWFAPEFERTASRIYHLAPGDIPGVALAAAAILAIASPGGLGVGRSLRESLAGMRADPVAPGLLGASVALAALDLPPLGAGWGEAWLVLAACAFAAWGRSAPAEGEAEGGGGPRRGAVAALVCVGAGAAAVSATSLARLVAQFHPGRTRDEVAVLVSLLVCGFVGAVGFGGFFEGRSRRAAGFGFLGLAGAASLVGLGLAHRLADSRSYQQYRNFFYRAIGAEEGNLLYDLVFGCAFGSLLGFALGAAARCLRGSERRLGMGAGCAGAGLGMLSVSLAPAPLDTRSSILGAALALGAVCAGGLLLGGGPLGLRVGALALVGGLGSFLFARAPAPFNVTNPFDFVPVEFLHWRETADGLAAAAANHRGDPIVRRDRVVVGTDAPGDRTGLSEIAVSAALAPELRRTLLVGLPLPRSVAALREAGAERVDASPSFPALGRMAQVFASAPPAKVESMRRAPGGLEGPYDLVLVSAPPAAMRGLASSFSTGRLRALAAAAGEAGTVAVWCRAGDLAGEDFAAVASTAARAWGSAECWLALDRYEGPSVGFVRRQPGAAVPADRWRALATSPLLREVGIEELGDVDSLRLAGPQPFPLDLGWAVRGCFPATERRAAGGWTPYPDTPDNWRAYALRKGDAVDLLARWARSGTLARLLGGLALHARAQHPFRPAVNPWERVEVSPEELERYREAVGDGRPCGPLARFLEEVGDLLLQKREYGLVYRFYEGLVSLAPDRPRLRRILAEALLELLDPEGAAGHLRVALEEDPRDPRATLLLARALQALGEATEACNALGRAAALDPGNPEVERFRREWGCK
jgi:hypothetical protein